MDGQCELVLSNGNNNSDYALFLFVVGTDFSKISFAFLFKFVRVNKAMWKPGGL